MKPNYLNFLFRHSSIFLLLEFFFETFYYLKNKLYGNSPRWIKKIVLRRNFLNDCITIETGTYFGQMSKFFSFFSLKCYTIEASLDHFNNAKKFLPLNVICLHGSSEELLESVIVNSLTYDNLNIFLDGHFSGGYTFMGENLSPIKFELEIIEKFISNFKKIVIAVDDVRCFKLGFENYPSINFLVDFCIKNNFSWHIEHDIFIMKKTLIANLIV